MSRFSSALSVSPSTHTEPAEAAPTFRRQRIRQSQSSAIRATAPDNACRARRRRADVAARSVYTFNRAISGRASCENTEVSKRRVHEPGGTQRVCQDPCLRSRLTHPTTAVEPLGRLASALGARLATNDERLLQPRLNQVQVSGLIPACLRRGLRRRGEKQRARREVFRSAGTEEPGSPQLRDSRAVRNCAEKEQRRAGKELGADHWLVCVCVRGWAVANETRPSRALCCSVFLWQRSRRGAGRDTMGPGLAQRAWGNGCAGEPGGETVGSRGRSPPFPIPLEPRRPHTILPPKPCPPREIPFELLRRSVQAQGCTLASQSSVDLAFVAFILSLVRCHSHPQSPSFPGLSLASDPTPILSTKNLFHGEK